MSSASAQVFGTVELLELILDRARHLDATELTRLQLVNSTFKALVEKLFPVERFLERVKTISYVYWDYRQERKPTWLYQMHITEPSEPDENFRWPESRARRCFHFIKLHPILKGHIVAGRNKTREEFINPDISGLATRDYTTNYRKGVSGHFTEIDTYFRLDCRPLLNLTRGGEWEKAFMTQPPVDHLRMEAHATMSEDESRFFYATFGIDHQDLRPITLGEFRDRLEAKIEEVEKKYPFEGVTLWFAGVVLIK